MMLAPTAFVSARAEASQVSNVAIPQPPPWM